jgi:hypothetical protein
MAFMSSGRLLAMALEGFVVTADGRSLKIGGTDSVRTVDGT